MKIENIITPKAVLLLMIILSSCLAILGIFSLFGINLLVLQNQISLFGSISAIFTGTFFSVILFLVLKMESSFPGKKKDFYCKILCYLLAFWFFVGGIISVLLSSSFFYNVQFLNSVAAITPSIAICSFALGVVALFIGVVLLCVNKKNSSNEEDEVADSTEKKESKEALDDVS